KLLLPKSGSDHAPWQVTAISTLFDALERRLAKYSPPAEVEASLTQLFAQARRQASTGDDEAKRLASLRLPGRSSKDLPNDLQTLASLVSATEPPAVQAAAIDRLGQIRDKSVPDALLANWGSRSPAIRAKILDALLSRPDGVAPLLASIEAKRVRVNDID